MKPSRGSLLLGIVLGLAATGCSGSPGSPAEGGPGGAQAPGVIVESRADAVAEIGPLAIGWDTDFTHHTVPLREFASGGPAKDGIPAIDRPRFAPVPATSYLEPQEPVIALAVGGEARAYPLQILVWHEIVNDIVAGTPVAVTFCPLCNTAIVFDRRVDGETLSFGTTGNLRNSDLVMYDRQTESWWQQFGGEGVVGRYSGTQLHQLPARFVSWADFRREHPEGLALTRETGHVRPYGENPYTGYDDVSKPPIFPTAHANDRRLPPKARVVLVESGDEAVAVPLSALTRKRQVRVEVGGRRLVVRVRGTAASPFSPRTLGTAEVVDERGQPVPFSEPFWFAVAAFRPTVLVKG